jgi:hypothetical protein
MGQILCPLSLVDKLAGPNGPEIIDTNFVEIDSKLTGSDAVKVSIPKDVYNEIIAEIHALGDGETDPSHRECKISVDIDFSADGESYTLIGDVWVADRTCHGHGLHHKITMYSLFAYDGEGALVDHDFDSLVVNRDI